MTRMCSGHLQSIQLVLTGTVGQMTLGLVFLVIRRVFPFVFFFIEIHKMCILIITEWILLKLFQISYG